MGIKMVLSSADSQSSSTTQVMTNRVSAYNNIISALETFIGSTDLQGTAYTSAKSYAENVLIPLAQGATLLSNGLSDSAKKFPDEYRSSVGEEDLDEDNLNTEIDRYSNMISNNETLLAKAKSADVVDPVTVLRYSMFISSAENAKSKAEEKLRKLREYDSNSSSFCEDMSSLEEAVSQGLSQVNADYSSFTGVFPDTSNRSMPWVKTINTAYTTYIEENQKSIYEEFKDVMDSDAAKYLSEAFKFLPSKLIKSLKQSEGFKEIIRGLAQSGEKGEKAATYVLQGLMKYEEFGNAIKNTKLGTSIAEASKVFDAAKKVADPIKSFVKEGLKSTKFYKAVSETAAAGGAVSGTLNFLGKGLKFAGKAATVLTFADVAISGVSGGVKEFAKTGDVGKGVIAGTFSAVKSVGPLEGATIGATIGSAIPFVGTFAGAVGGALFGCGICYLDKKGTLDAAEDLTKKFYDKSKKVVGKAVKSVGEAISTTFGGIGKALGFG